MNKQEKELLTITEMFVATIVQKLESKYANQTYVGKNYNKRNLIDDLKKITNMLSGVHPS